MVLKKDLIEITITAEDENKVLESLKKEEFANDPQYLHARNFDILEIEKQE